MARPRLIGVPITIAVLILFALGADSVAKAQEAPEDWRVASNYSIEETSHRFEFPSSILVVPDPGDDPDSPVMFIGELNGAIKVLTRSGEIEVFASDFVPINQHEVNDIYGEFGLVGMCLSPEHGYLYATYTYFEGGLLRNGITRFTSTPVVYGTSPAESLNMDSVFAGTFTFLSHSIGSCVIDGDEFYVGVGDGYSAQVAQDPTTFRGKILRMDLDGNPFEDNPFFELGEYARYVYALGFRNAYGLTFVDGELYAADNGTSIDRVIKIEKGRDYLWDGKDSSIAATGGVVLNDAGGVAGVGSFDPPSLNESFADGLFVVRPRRPARILTMELSESGSGLAASPETILNYVGEQDQILSAVALAPKGLYFSPLIPERDGSSALYLVRRQDGLVQESVFGANNGRSLVEQYGCHGCHIVLGAGRTVGPSLDTLVPRLNDRLHSSGYESLLRELNRTQDPDTAAATARAMVLEASGDDRTREWIVQRLIDPTFDSPRATMPNLGITPAEAEAMTDFLVANSEPEEESTLISLVDWAFPEEATESNSGRRWLATFFGFGFIFAAIVIGATFSAWFLGRRLMRAKRES